MTAAATTQTALTNIKTEEQIEKEIYCVIKKTTINQPAVIKSTLNPRYGTKSIGINCVISFSNKFEFINGDNINIDGIRFKYNQQHRTASIQSSLLMITIYNGRPI